MNSAAQSVAERLTGGLVPAVPVPFHGDAIAKDAQRQYAAWMATQPVAGVAVWAHTGRGPYLDGTQRRFVLESWRKALPGGVIVAGARDAAMAHDARAGGADALLAFPSAADPVEHHRTLAGELPVIAFYLYRAAGGADYDDDTLHEILELPGVLGIKVATLDSVMTYQRIAAVMRAHPDKLLITGEDRFLGYSLMLGARAALIGMGAALCGLQAELLRSVADARWNDFQHLSRLCDELSQATFIEPMEGYIRRMLWALAEDGVIPEDCCEDPWGPALDPTERDAVRRAVQNAHAARP
ncbi:MAG: dihydrodipicolinate synthase family protein [Gemmatimonadota bacterium]